MLNALLMSLKEAGPLSFLSLATGVIGLVLTAVAVVVAKSNAGKALATLGLLAALATLALGFAGYSLGMVATNAALGNVPDDQFDALLRKGTEESRLNLVFGLAGAALPLLLGLLAAARARFGFGLALAGLGVVGAAGLGVQLAKPLPPGEPPVVEAPGLTLAESKAQRPLDGAALISLTPDGVWANGARVPTLTEALKEPLVAARCRGAPPVLVDARVKFSALADLLEAAAQAGRDSVLLVVRSKTGERRVISVRTRALEETGKPALLLTVSVTAEHFFIGASGGALPSLPNDAQVLNDKLAEVKASFPDVDSVRVTASPELTFDALVHALDATMQRDHRVLYPDVTLGRFPLPKSDAE